jgi:nicotinamidase-related amidase
MSLSCLDPHTALIIIDLQQGIVALPLAHPVDTVVANACQLLRAFRQHGRPVVLVNVAGVAPGRTDAPRRSGALPAGWSDLITDLDRQPTDHTVTKHTWGAFTGTDLHAYLQQNGVTQVVIAGISTSIGVESTARQAQELGFNVTLAEDAMTDMQLEAHQNSLTRIFPRLGETGSTAQIIALLDQSSGAA